MGMCGKDKVYTDKPQWFDPLGPDNTTGGPGQRNRIFGEISATAPQLRQQTQETAGALRTAASAPGYAEAQNYARKVIAGDYLTSPYMDKAMSTMRARTLADAANQDARIKAQYGRAGMGFSTAAQQASQANRAAANASANTNEAQTRLRAYQAERQLQSQAPAIYDAATAAPLNYLSQIPTALLGSLAQQAQIVSGLAGSGQIATPNSTIVRQPGAMDYVLGGLQAVGGSM